MSDLKESIVSFKYKHRGVFLIVFSIMPLISLFFYWIFLEIESNVVAILFFGGALVYWNVVAFFSDGTYMITPVVYRWDDSLEWNICGIVFVFVFFVDSVCSAAFCQRLILYEFLFFFWILF